MTCRGATNSGGSTPIKDEYQSGALQRSAGSTTLYGVSQRYAAGRLRPGRGGGSTVDRRTRPLPSTAGVGALGAGAADRAHDQAALGLGGGDEGGGRRQCPEPQAGDAPAAPARPAAHAAAGCGGA